MLYDFKLESDLQVCPADRAGIHMDIGQRRTHSWIVQFDNLPGRNKDLVQLYRYFVRIWKLNRQGYKFVGFCLLPSSTISRVLARYRGIMFKQLLVSDRYFEATFSISAGAMPVNVIWGYVVPLEDRQAAVDYIHPGTVIDNRIIRRHSTTIQATLEVPGENLWKDFVNN
jgi:hypothetical protein